MTKPKLERKIEVPSELIKDLLTDSELRMVKQRFLIVNLLEEGLTIREIAAQVRVGTDTVVRTARMLEKRNIRKLLNKSKGVSKKIKSKTPWIFGKSD